ncbi:MAG TPA: hypothetical protein VFE03_01510 [Caulobacteraceae bacterium]|jgi:hypothetical protein|nr:hypothetical protein [Caulobacteraceae bacterium]
MWTLLWRLIAGLAGLGLAGGGGYALSRAEANPDASNALIVGGWIMIILLAVGCIALLISGFATAVLHIQDRGHGEPPAAED